MTIDSSNIPYRVCLCGEFVDLPLFRASTDGFLINCSIQPRYPFLTRCGMATSSRYVATQLWGKDLPTNLSSNELAMILYTTERDHYDTLTGTSDAFGIVLPGVSAIHYGINDVWADNLFSLTDYDTLQFIHDYVYLLYTHPRVTGFNPCVSICQNQHAIKQLMQSSRDCWYAIRQHDPKLLGLAMNECYNAQTSLLPLIETPQIRSMREELSDHIYGSKLTGGGGGGYLVVVSDVPIENSIRLYPTGFNE